MRERSRPFVLEVGIERGKAAGWGLRLVWGRGWVWIEVGLGLCPLLSCRPLLRLCLFPALLRLVIAFWLFLGA